MANQEHVDRLLQGVEAWNQWRMENPEIKPDLIDANLIDTNLIDANLSSADLRHAKLRHAKLFNADLHDADLHDADLSYAKLFNTDLHDANLSYAKLSRADLSHANLSDADLNYADLHDANLSYVYLNNADLISADLRDANLNFANLSDANLSDADLSAIQALHANFQAATLTGACIEDWNINSCTNLQEIICEYVFTGWFYDSEAEKLKLTDRRPHDPNQIFAPGEFTKRYQIVLETVDLFFHDGINWKAFLASLQGLRTKYGDDLNIQGIEKKAGNAILVRLEVPSDSDKGAVEQDSKELYEIKLRLQLQGEQLEFFKKQVEIEQTRNTRLLERMFEAMAEKESPRYDLRGARFGGGFAADGGTQTGGTFNDFSQNIEQNINEIGGLIQSLRNQAEAFPEGIRQETLEHIGDLESDIQQPPEQRKPSRIKATLLALAGMATLVSGAVAGANEFAGNLQELSDKLGIPLPIEQLQPQPQPDAIDVQAIGSDRS